MSDPPSAVWKTLHYFLLLSCCWLTDMVRRRAVTVAPDNNSFCFGRQHAKLLAKANVVGDDGRLICGMPLTMTELKLLFPF